MATQRLRTSKYPYRRVDLPLARLLAEAANEELPTDRIASKLNLAEDVVAELAPIFRGMNDTQLAWAVETHNRRISLERKVLRQSRPPYEDLAGRLPMYTYPVRSLQPEENFGTASVIDLFQRDAGTLEAVLRTALKHGPLSDSERAQLKALLWQLGIAKLYARQLPSPYKQRGQALEPEAFSQAAGYRAVAASLEVVAKRLALLSDALDTMGRDDPTQEANDAFRYTRSATAKAQEVLAGLTGTIESLKRRGVMLRRHEHEASLGVRLMPFPLVDAHPTSTPQDIWLDDQGLCLRSRQEDGVGKRQRLRVSDVKLVLDDLPPEFSYLASAPELDFRQDPTLLDWDIATRQHIVVPFKQVDPKLRGKVHKPNRAVFIEGEWVWVTPLRKRRG